MRHTDAPSSAAPANNRLTEIASILAAAILRLRRRVVWNAAESADGIKTCLEVLPETVLNGHHG